MKNIFAAFFISCLSLFYIASLQAEVVEEKPETPVFGQSLFNGGFTTPSFQGFNPNYRINVGDTISLQLWGGYQVTTQLTVDAQGNVFIPNIGPVRLLGVANKDLNDVILDKVSSVYQSNVKIYANLNATQPVNVFVTGFVGKPGLYGGLSSDSILTYIQKAGGIISSSGSYLDIQLKRDTKTIQNYDLYQFVLEGEIPQQQLHDGDVLVVGPKKSTVQFDGLVENPVQLEFAGDELALHKALDIIGLEPEVTHLRLTRGNLAREEVEYLALADSLEAVLRSGDKVEAVADKPKGTIVVFVEGEHAGRAEYVLDYGATYGDLLEQIQFSELSAVEDIQVFRREVAQRQKEMLNTTLRSLESVALSARSATTGEAQIRTSDAQLLSQFIERAKTVEPLGHVTLGKGESKQELVLKNFDRIYVPSKSLLVSVNGQVMFPGASVWKKGMRVADYIELSGGFTHGNDENRVVVIQRDGTVRTFEGGRKKLSRRAAYVNPGDEILVIPKIDAKKIQFAIDITNVIYQIALIARVAVLL